ncbi:MAG: bifunctional riboflavin kinase/FAD synthetase [Proteobacteria bacterium]|nr:bifunctional riboflavin kinase/FAD synthetase [Pseudomonadota bacterium]
MKFFRSTSAAARFLTQDANGSVVTIGNFDGVHIGHQAMLKAAREHADRLQLPLVVLSFDPHPEAYFSPETAPARLSSLGERVVMLQKLGVNIACILPFDADLAAIEHEEFVRRVLYDQLNARCVIIGDDFHYGAGRRGNGASLSQAANKMGFEVFQLGSVMEQGSRVSSTRIRHLLQASQLDEAAHFLGRRYQMMGRVTHGDARGRTWGFPTLNLPMRHRRALKGVFAVRVSGLDKEYTGVANLGTRPTVGGGKTLLEVHLFDYTGDAYGERVCVDFYAQIRQEQKFASFELLKAQIGRDIIKSKAYFEQLDA